MTALILSQGVPMLLAGDELSQTQQGNNNTYCQDSELTWLHWDLNEEQRAFGDFVRGDPPAAHTPDLSTPQILPGPCHPR
jgi:glycogen operon protein